MLQQPANKTGLETLGEFGLIDKLTNGFEIQNESSKKGIGDDAAVMNYGDRDVLVSSDMLLEGIHFDLTYMPIKHLGYKAAVVNFSDIYAMNGKPEQLTIGLACSNRFPVEALEQLYEGIAMACKNYGVDLVGGDTTSSRAGLVLSLTVLGSVEKGKAIGRDGAKKGDLLVVSGDLGGAYVGLQLLEREKSVFMDHPDAQPDLEGNDYILERQLKPEARRDVVELLSEMGVTPTSMIDVSDGLSSEIMHLCKNSSVGCALYEEKIPIDPTTYNMAREFALDPTVCALSGGEDYELLFTIKQEDFEKVKGNMLVSIIGHMTDADEGIRMIDKSGGVHELKAQGWNSFQ
ncbi:MAG TPA: thiamine-phosphate kinase [Flavobacteriales bacterium]|nr:thiamine-phosphate kinase [Flavobacteriales bacterium]